ncbi:hypothetical protein BT96DRAFT_926139 [Gymnopus androsaceus JB14]|uniref:Uncharacterized protein n=1 Tax=Gymnopus androsaceus JB14 TaxID=1447944 RepID=A0A6A4GW55_9AGAR|nr:hypothetical protein BT96DRAFT_926139 [Gymnopus androsaceus JB14]
MEKLRSKYSSEDSPFTVHRYGPANLTQTCAEALLREGELLLKQVFEDKWHNVELQAGSNVQNAANAKEGNFSLEQLQEFENTNLSDLFVGQSQSRGVKRPHSTEEVEDELRKFPRSDTGSLQRVIPQPHIQLSETFPNPDFTKTKAYNRAPPIFIAPHTVHSPDKFSRRAWIIPARGSLPWNAASSSMVLHPAGFQVLAINATESMIQWSHAALASFWKYLIQLKNLNTLGPLSLSFHPSKTSLLLKKEKSRAPSHAADVSVSISQSSLGAQSSTLSTRSLLRDSDYFKVYHDAQISMHVRSALDLFPFVEEQPVASQEGAEAKPIKCRPLKGARLVLVDERSNGLLIA